MDVLAVVLPAVAGLGGACLGAWLSMRGQMKAVIQERQHERDNRLIEAVVDVQEAMLHEPGLAEMMSLETEESRAPMLKATRRLALWGGDEAADALVELAFEASSGNGTSNWHNGSAMFQGWARTATDYVRRTVSTDAQVRDAYKRHQQQWLDSHQ
ncbi:hypothetical protein JOE38_001155 [Clavibacter michiganensis]|uniref:hypothetical protein n=1 Tax=Clavibacter michiganensis TaxID=28447 RepID=UPI00195A1A8A|nr:hypothetical protein [Clavibacter michiganensis]MBM7411332.1 hypothetical protein [Clavibacter michiganensis]